MAKHTIFYYSGTGNSLYTALRISEKLGDSEVISIPKNRNEKITCSSEVIGFVFPIYGHNVPMIVYKFIENLQISSDSYFFAIATYGLFSGRTLATVNKLLVSKNARLNYGKNLKMVGNCIVVYNQYQNVEKTLKRADRKIQKYSSEISERKFSNIRKGFRSKDEFACISESSDKYSKKAEGFTVSDSCSRCKICIKVCQVQNIKLSNDKLVFGDKCMQCQACIQWCPCKAINWNNKTQLRRRYHHPKIEINQLF